jgi:transposase-like protein
MAQKQYSQEFKEQVIKECNDVGNVSLVAAGMTYPQTQSMAG